MSKQDVVLLTHSLKSNIYVNRDKTWFDHISFGWARQPSRLKMILVTGQLFALGVTGFLVDSMVFFPLVTGFLILFMHKVLVIHEKICLEMAQVLSNETMTLKTELKKGVEFFSVRLKCSQENNASSSDEFTKEAKIFFMDGDGSNVSARQILKHLRDYDELFDKSLCKPVEVDNIETRFRKEQAISIKNTFCLFKQKVTARPSSRGACDEGSPNEALSLDRETAFKALAVESQQIRGPHA